MRLTVLTVWIALTALTAVVFPAASYGQNAGADEPGADRILIERTFHGVKISDYYGWLKAKNWQEAVKKPALLPEKIKKYLIAENDYFKSKIKPTKPLQEFLYKELVGRVVQADNAVPTVDRKFAYFTRQVAGKNYSQEVRRPRDMFVNEAAFFSIKPSPYDQVLLDGNNLAEGKKSFSLSAVAHSMDHRLLAYATDFTGSEYYQIFVRDLSTGRDLGDVVNNSDGNMVWMPDGRGFYYGLKNKNGRTNSVWRHLIGNKQGQDIKIFQTDDAKGFTAKFSLTRNSKFLILRASNTDVTESYFLDPDVADQQPTLIAKREKDLVYGVSSHADRFFILTNADGAKDFKIMQVQVKNPARKNWQEFVAHRPGRLIVAMAAFSNHLVRFEREDGQDKIVIMRLADGDEHTIKFDDNVYDLDYRAGYEFDSDTIRVFYSSPVQPASTFDYNMKTRKMVLRKRQIIPSGHNSENYITKRVFASGHDGVKVPLSLLYHKDTKLDGSAPVFLYGYGAYGVTTYTAFLQNAFSLVDRGFIYVRSHPRGGKEKGQQWYEDGRRDKKINTYKDYIAVADFLIENKYTSRGKIVAYGISAGGMIMGYIANETSGVFGAIIADVPFVDVLNTMLDTSLPLTPEEWPEWGNPIKDPKAFKYIASYSPYDNVKAKAYPPILVTASISDVRVTYWEPAKWVAKLRAKRINKELLLLRTDMNAGHSGGSGRFLALRKTALIYAFAIKTMGLENTPSMTAK